MNARVYDVSMTGIASTRTKVIEVVGTFFKVLSATYPVSIQTDKGDSVECLPGQGMRYSTPFARLTVVNSSSATNQVKILAGVGEMIDDRLSGDLNTIDMAKAKTVAGEAFTAFGETNSTAGTRAFAQLYNGSLSRFLLVKAIRAHSWSTNLYGHLMLVSGRIGSLTGVVGSKKANAFTLDTISGVEYRTLVQAAPPTTLGRIGFVAATTSNAFGHVFDPPLMLQNACSLVVEQQFANSQFAVSFEFTSEPV